MLSRGTRLGPPSVHDADDGGFGEGPTQEQLRVLLHQLVGAQESDKHSMAAFPEAGGSRDPKNLDKRQAAHDRCTQISRVLASLEGSSVDGHRCWTKPMMLKEGTSFTRKRQIPRQGQGKRRREMTWTLPFVPRPTQCRNCQTHTFFGRDSNGPSMFGNAHL